MASCADQEDYLVHFLWQHYCKDTRISFNCAQSVRTNKEVDSQELLYVDTVGSQLLTPFSDGRVYACFTVY